MAQTGDKALHYSAGKSGVDQIPPAVLLSIGQVFTYGEQKYARNNWLQGNEWHEFYGSLLRHALRWASGEDYDPESGLHHLDHCAWNAIALHHFQMNGIGKDDRSGTQQETTKTTQVQEREEDIHD